ncbi:MAG: hypothetical protein QFB89_06675 [Pseudomonadota bacterium]|nr:hypothetical protein [Pseudomonadota bacterium]
MSIIAAIWAVAASAASVMEVTNSIPSFAALAGAMFVAGNIDWSAKGGCNQTA